VLTIRSHRLHQNNPSVTWGRLRMVDRRWGLIVTDHACPAGTYRLVEFDDVRRRGRCRGGGFAAAHVSGGDGDEVLNPAAEDVAQRGHQVQRNPFGALVNHAIHLRA
jgi:hypothetical protein